jgi:hypothetical protein
VTEAGDREQLGDALDQANDDGLGVGQVGHDSLSLGRVTAAARASKDIHAEGLARATHRTETNQVQLRFDQALRAAAACAPRLTES